MRVFLSSVVSGMEAFRRAAADAVTLLGHDAVRAEDFGARTGSPRVECLTRLRDSDVVVLLMGERYGDTQPSGLSPTHEEYLEAKDRMPVLVFVQQGITPDSAQAQFVSDVENWDTGLYRGSFTTPEDLHSQLVRVLHEFELSRATGPVSEEDLGVRATALEALEPLSEPYIQIDVVGGPATPLLRPSVLEDPETALWIQQDALYGRARVFDTRQGVTSLVKNDLLVMKQDSHAIAVGEDGSVALWHSLVDHTSPRVWGLGIPAVIQEDVAELISQQLRFVWELWESIDAGHRLTHARVRVVLRGAGGVSWSTAGEYDPRRLELVNAPRVVTALLTPLLRRREELKHGAESLGLDLAVVLGRGFRKSA